MRKAPRTEPAISTRLATIICLAIVICVSAVVPARAQKKPPILADGEISAFNTQDIRNLENTASGTDANAQIARNKLIAIGVEQIDAAFNDYRKKSRKRHDRLQFLFDFLEIGASSAINIITGGERARSLIAEGLSLFQGSRAAFNKDFRFLERQILFDKMVAKRSQKLTEIYAKLNDGMGEYSWEQARSELRSYFYAGTIDEALSSLSVDTGAEAKDSKDKLERAQRKAGIKVAVTKEQADANTAASNVFRPIITDSDQNKSLAKMKAIYDAAALDPDLKGQLNILTQDEDLEDRDKEAIGDALTKIKENRGDFAAYRLVLGYLRRQVINLIPTDPRPNKAFQEILKQNQ